MASSSLSPNFAEWFELHNKRLETFHSAACIYQYEATLPQRRLAQTAINPYSIHTYHEIQQRPATGERTAPLQCTRYGQHIPTSVHPLQQHSSRQHATKKTTTHGNKLWSKTPLQVTYKIRSTTCVYDMKVHARRSSTRNSNLRPGKMPRTSRNQKRTTRGEA